jgi:hypothetical protein
MAAIAAALDVTAESGVADLSTKFAYAANSQRPQQHHRPGSASSRSASPSGALRLPFHYEGTGRLRSRSPTTMP